MLLHGRLSIPFFKTFSKSKSKIRLKIGIWEASSMLTIPKKIKKKKNKKKRKNKKRKNRKKNIPEEKLE